MYRYFLLIVFFAFLVLSAWSPNGIAGSLPGEKGAADKLDKSGKSKEAEEPIKARKRVLHMQEIEILGNVEKPKAMFIIPRTPHQYYSNKYKRDFSEEILRPITKQGVADRQEWQETVTVP